jgi:hypothetical protein
MINRGNLAMTGFRIGVPEILTDCVVDGEAICAGRHKKFILWITSTLESTSGVSAFSGFGVGLRKTRGLSQRNALDNLAMTTASNSVASVGRLLGHEK